MYQINHIGVVVTDMERSVRFYQDVLGCKIKDTLESDELRLTYLDCAGQIIELVWRKTDLVAARDGAAGRVDHIAFLVPDIDKAVAALKEKKVILLSDAPREMEKQKVFFFSGPDGERLEFVELKKLA